MNMENLNDIEIKNMEAEINARRNEVKPTYQHYGSAENLNGSEIESMEAEIRTRRNEVKPTYQHYGSAENLNGSEIESMEAQVAEKRKQDIPYNEYFNNLINNPLITDENQFEAAAIRSMQSNGIIRKFIEQLFEKLYMKSFELKKVDKNDRIKIESTKKEIESLITIYEKYLYVLKKHQWNFSDLNAIKIPEDIKENLWQQQRRLDIVFTMPIPADLGQHYGKQFERNGNMIPGLNLIYEELSGKNVNWHQVMIYGENELTPYQRFKQNQEEKRQEFINARKQEIERNLSNTKSNEIEEVKHI